MMINWNYCKSWRAQTQKTKLAYWSDSRAESNHMLLGRLPRINLKRQRWKQTHHVSEKIWLSLTVLFQIAWSYFPQGEFGRRLDDIISVWSDWKSRTWSFPLCCVLWQRYFCPSSYLRPRMGTSKLQRHPGNILEATLRLISTVKEQ